MPDYRALAQALGTSQPTPQEIERMAALQSPAFGVFPQMQPYRSQQDITASANVPVDLLRGRVAGTRGLFGDVVNQPIPMVRPLQLLSQAFTGQQKYPDTEHYLETMPLKSNTPIGDVAGKIGSFAPINPMPAVKGYLSLLGNEINAGLTGQPTRSVIGQITPKPLQLDVYHGSPHRFPPTERNSLGEFDASKIGTGEGAQSYGYGIYTAENPSVAREYLIENNWFDTSKATYKGKPIDYWYDKAQRDQDLAIRTNNKQLLEDSNVRLGYWENIMTHTPPEKVLKTVSDPDYGWDKATEYAKSIELDKFKGIPQSGAFYKADLPDEKIAKMLDYDLPLHQQPPEVQAAVEKLMGLKVDKTKLNEFDDALLNALQTDNTIIPKQPTNPMGYDLLRMLGKNDQEVARKLQELGVPGVKYFDAGSRDNMQGTRNFVIFPNEEKNVTILERQ